MLDATDLPRGSAVTCNIVAKNWKIRGLFGKYVDNFNKMRIKYTRRMEFCINEYQLLNNKYDQYENRTLINDLDISH